MKKKIIQIFIVLFFGMITKSEAQFLYNRYVNVKIGQGIVYGGWGVNVEYRRNHFSIALDGGYQGSQYIYDHDVDASYNTGACLRYYYFRKQGSWQLYSGIYTGWLNNYYHPDIGTDSYHSTVYGTAFLLGLEIREELFNVELGVSIDPGMLIFNKSTHPCYNKDWYILPNFGIGVNLYALHTAFKNRKKFKHSPVKTITTAGVIDTASQRSLVAIHEKLIHEQANNLIQSCETAPAAYNEKAFYQNDTLYIFKQVGIGQYVYGKIFLPYLQRESFYTTSIEPSNQLLKIFFIEDNLTIPSPEELITLYEEEENLIEAKQGLVSLYIHEQRCHVKLEQVSFKKGSLNLYFDSISLCKMNLFIPQDKKK